MDIPDEVMRKFMNFERTARVKFCLNDSIQVKSGKYKGTHAAVISINSFMPEIEYLIESSDGYDLIVKQEEIELVQRRE